MPDTVHKQSPMSRRTSSRDREHEGLTGECDPPKGNTISLYSGGIGLSCLLKSVYVLRDVRLKAWRGSTSSPMIAEAQKMVHLGRCLADAPSYASTSVRADPSARQSRASSGLGAVVDDAQWWRLGRSSQSHAPHAGRRLCAQGRSRRYVRRS